MHLTLLPLVGLYPTALNFGNLYQASPNQGKLPAFVFSPVTRTRVMSVSHVCRTASKAPPHSPSLRRLTVSVSTVVPVFSLPFS